MRAARPDMAQVIVGDGPSRRSLEKALPRAHFTGFIPPDALARHYASADLFLFPRSPKPGATWCRKRWPAVWRWWPFAMLLPPN